MATLASFFVLFLTAALVLAATPPEVLITTYSTIFGNVTIAAEPVGRGTFSILIGSTAAFLFCVWGAVHPDIIPDVGVKRRGLYKSMWMLATIMAPQGTIVCSYRQLQEARKIHKAWKKKLKESSEISGKELADNFGMKGAFLVTMGGFIIDEFKEVKFRRQLRTCLRKFASKPLLDETTKVPYTSTLTIKGFMSYLETNRIAVNTFGPKILDDGTENPYGVDLRSLADKGNSGLAGKLVATTQILWFLAQCISRGIYHLPLTLLEIHVVIQVLGTFIIWACWWEKPYDVNEPFLIRLQKPRPTPLMEGAEKTGDIGVTEVIHNLRVDGRITSSQSYDPYEQDSCLLGHRLIQNLSFPTYTTNETTKAYNIEKSSEYNLDLDFITTSNLAGPLDITMKAYYDIVKYVQLGGKEVRSTVVESLLVCLIGGLHAAAWNTHFSSVAEGILWKISCLAMCTLVPIVPISVYFRCHDCAIRSLWEIQFMDSNLSNLALFAIETVYLMWSEDMERNKGLIKWWFLRVSVKLFVSTALFCFIIAYGVSVVFITIESYISLRSPPDGAFLTPRWTSYWPHL